MLDVSKTDISVAMDIVLLEVEIKFVVEEAVERSVITVEVAMKFLALGFLFETAEVVNALEEAGATVLLGTDLVDVAVVVIVVIRDVDVVVTAVPVIVSTPVVDTATWVHLPLTP